ncbi:uncharacterized protein LOC134541683 isoform X2 [Bacillus rossius redtenbacheri]
MTYTDMKDLVAVLKESENMAVVSSSEAHPENMQVEPHGETGESTNQSEEKLLENLNEEFVELKGKKQTQSKLHSNKFSTDNSDLVSVSEITPVKSPSLELKPNDDVAEIDENMKRQDVGDEEDVPKVTAGMARTENMELDVESTLNIEPLKGDDSDDVDMLPDSQEQPGTTKIESFRKIRSLGLKKTSSLVRNCTSSASKHTAKDDGNINVFDSTDRPHESTDKLQRRCVQTQERFPFFLLQQGVNLDTFTKHFKKYVDRYRKNLLHIQRSSVNFLEWGKPISITFLKGGASAADPKKLDLSKPASSNAYNFRERAAKNKDPYSLDSGNFEDDPAIGMGAKETYISDSSGSESEGITLKRDKRKSEHKEDSEWNNSPDSVRPSVCKRIKYSVSKANSKNFEDVDSDEDFEPTGHKRTQKRNGRRGGGRGRAGKSVETGKSSLRKQPSNRGRGKAVKALVVEMEGIEDSVLPELCCQKSEEFDLKPQQSPPKQSQDNASVASSSDSIPNSQELSCKCLNDNAKETSDSSDITFLGSAPTQAVAEKLSGDVMCPICGKNFTPEEIELHASTCDLYCSDRSQNEDVII